MARGYHFSLSTLWSIRKLRIWNSGGLTQAGSFFYWVDLPLTKRSSQNCSEHDFWSCRFSACGLAARTRPSFMQDPGFCGFDPRLYLTHRVVKSTKSRDPKEIQTPKNLGYGKSQHGKHYHMYAYTYIYIYHICVYIYMHIYIYIIGIHIYVYIYSI